MTLTNDGQSGVSNDLSRGPGGVTAAPPHIVLVDDDDRFREALCLSLIDEGCEVTSFSGDARALEHFAAGGRADVVLLDWRKSGANGLEVLRGLRQSGTTMPVIFLTVLSGDIEEEAALQSDAADFIDKLRRLPLLVKRHRSIVEGTRSAPEMVERRVGDVVRLGRLELRFDTSRASWAGRRIDLTLTEFKIVALLALGAGHDVSYREIYDLVRRKNVATEYGDAGSRDCVRTFIKRIRKKFRDVDPEFEPIHNYARFGYRWLSPHA
jgi:two-component system response regulator ChvI